MKANPSAPSPASHNLIRLPLLGLAAVLCMGSGMGNPGCGRSGPTRCSDLCSVEGSYQLSFEDSSPLPPGCEQRGLTLPTGPMVITRNDGDLTTRLNDIELSGAYSGGSYGGSGFVGSGPVRNPSGEELRATITLEGWFDPRPADTSAPSAFKGTYKLQTTRQSENDLACDVTRAFTATR